MLNAWARCTSLISNQVSTSLYIAKVMYSDVELNALDISDMQLDHWYWALSPHTLFLCFLLCHLYVYLCFLLLVKIITIVIIIIRQDKNYRNTRSGKDVLTHNNQSHCRGSSSQLQKKSLSTIKIRLPYFLHIFVSLICLHPQIDSAPFTTTSETVHAIE